MQIATFASSLAAAAGPGALSAAAAGMAPGMTPGTELGADPDNSGSVFGDALKSAIGNIDSLEQQAADSVTGLLQGSRVDIHDAMIATQKADMAFELALAVRNKAIAAYQQLMGMQF